MKQFFGNKYVKGITQFIPDEHFGPRDYIDWYCEQMGLSREEYMAGYRIPMDMRFNESKKKPGPDPYMTGLDDKTREEKEEQMKKQAEMDDDDPDAYKPMPGSAEARKRGKVKTSKYTKKYHELYGDDEANESLTEASKRDPESIRKEYKELKKLSIGKLRKMWSLSYKIGNPKELDKEGLISDILRDKHGRKYVAAAFESFVVESGNVKPLPEPLNEERAEGDRSPMGGDDPDAYKPMPGSAEARKKGKVKTSKFTKKYHELYGEGIVNESQVKGSKVVKILSNPNDWGEDAKLQVYTKGNNMIYIDTWFYGGDKALADLVKSWSPGGEMYKYFVEKEGIKPTIVDSFIEVRARGRHKKLTDDGIVGVELSFTKVGVNESINEEKAEGDRSPIDDEKIETALKKKADETGVPIGILRIIMRRGMAAWKTGHRPGATQQQWGYARVASFLVKGEGTWGGADADVAKEVRDGGHDKKLKKG